jgi:aspartate/methionine/tyrosine aminotransferase
MSSFTEKMSVKVPDFVQRAVLAAFRAGKRELTSAKRMVAASVKSACEELKKTGWEFYAPDTGFYVFPQVARGKADSGKFAEYVLTKYGVGVLPGTVFGDYPEFLRLAIAGSSRTVRTAIERLRSASDEWSRR